MIEDLPPVCLVRSLAQARIALAPGRPVTLISARGAGMFAGVSWWRALVEAARDETDIEVHDILDCADAPGRALEALRLGQRLLVLAPSSTGFADTVARAEGLGARVLAARPRALDCGRRGASHDIGPWLDRASRA